MIWLGRTEVVSDEEKEAQSCRIVSGREGCLLSIDLDPNQGPIAVWSRWTWAGERADRQPASRDCRRPLRGAVTRVELVGACRRCTGRVASPSSDCPTSLTSTDYKKMMANVFIAIITQSAGKEMGPGTDALLTNRVTHLAPLLRNSMNCRS